MFRGHPRPCTLWLAAMASAALSASVLASVRVIQQTDRRLPASSSSVAERRLALVVGNDAYPERPLTNAVNDARALAAALRETGFDVTEAHNLRRAPLDRAVDEFVARLRAGDVPVFYYSGHGFSLGNENYLVPIGFSPADPIEAKYEAYALGPIHERIVARNVRLTILVLDACRDSPFLATRQAAGGWTGMQAGRGSYIAFATAPGQTASDNPAGGNGLFTGELIKVLRQPGLTLDQIFGEVGRRVQAASRNRQTPWTSQVAGAGQDFAFRPAAAAAGPPSPARAEDLARREELAFWESIRDSRDPRVFEDYLQRYPAGQFRVVAQSKLDELRAAAKPVAPPGAARPAPGGSGASAHRAGDVRPDANVAGVHWAFIPAGTFQMGCVPNDSECDDDEKPRHSVTLTRPFELMTTEVTVAMWKAYVRTGRAALPSQPDWNQGDRQPVVNVDWSQAGAFCLWLGGRLPTEAEWEYAARGGRDGWKFVWGDAVTPVLEGRPTANVADESRKNPWIEFAGYNDGYANAAPVGWFAPNGYGLFDMGGNVSEWVADWAGRPLGTPTTDPAGPAFGNGRVVRGGSWAGGPGALRVSSRSASDSGNREAGVGLRCARDVSE